MRLYVYIYIYTHSSFHLIFHCPYATQTLNPKPLNPKPYTLYYSIRAFPFFHYPMVPFFIRYRPWFSVQFHPEACGGPTDTDFLFDYFLQFIAEPTASPVTGLLL